MRYSNTTLRELKKRYRNILIKCALMNVALMAFAMPAISADRIVINHGETRSASDSIFEDLTTDKDGTAIYNNGIFKIEGSVTFKNNKGNGTGGYSHGGAVYTYADGNTSLGATDAVITFESNSVTQSGGAIYESGKTDLIGKNITFNNNTANMGGGAVYLTTWKAKNSNGGALSATAAETILFSNNKALGSGGAGAIYAGGNLLDLQAQKITFTGNTSTNLDGAGSPTLSGGKTVGSYAGAVFISNGKVDIIGDEITFSNNHAYAIGRDVEDATDEDKYRSAQYGGGAIQIRGAATASSVNGSPTLTLGKTGGTNLFEKNSSAMNGGAFHSRSMVGTDSAKTTINGTTSFTSNTAGTNGGAVSNIAIAGSTDITFNGDTTFEGNTARGNGGAVYNAGNNASITFNGKTVFNGNQDGEGANDIYNDGTITFAGEVTLDSGIKGAGTVQFAEGTTLNATLQTTTILANTVTFSGNNTLNLTIQNGLADNTYDFITAQGDLNGQANVTIAENAVYNLELTEDGKINVSVKSGEELAESIDAPVSEQEANTLSAIISSNGNSTTVGNQIASSISEALQEGNASLAVDTAKKVAPTTSQMIVGIAKEAAKTMARITGARMDAISGRSGGDITEGAGLWMQALYNHTKQDSTSTTDGFKANSRGLAIGVDKEVTDTTTLGIGYGYMNTDADSYGRDVEVDGHNFFIYGKYQPSKWYVSSVLNYNYSKYTEKKTPLGISLRSEYDVNSYGIQLMTGYDMDNGLTPEMGLRYLDVDADSYNDGMQRIRSNHDDVLTAVAGIKYTTNVKSDGVVFKPTARLAATYDVISDNSRANVSVIGGSNYAIDGKRLHRFGVEAGLGVTAQVDNIDITLEYNGAFRQDYKSQGGMLRARYNF